MKKKEQAETVARVKQGDREAAASLWKEVEWFIRWKATDYIRNDFQRRTTKEDLVQAGGLAMYDAVEIFDPSKDCAFTTILEPCLKKRFAEEAGIRTSRRDVLQYADSYNETAYSEGDFTVEETIEDEGAASELASVEYNDLVLYSRRVILSALAGLSESYCALLTAYYFNGIPLAVAAGYKNRASASEAHRRALWQLRTYSKYKNELRACLDAFEELEPYRCAAGQSGSGFYLRTGISSTEGAAIAGM